VPVVSAHFSSLRVIKIAPGGSKMDVILVRIGVRIRIRVCKDGNAVGLSSVVSPV